MESFIVDGARVGRALHRARILSCTNMQRTWTAGVGAWSDRSIARAFSKAVACRYLIAHKFVINDLEQMRPLAG